MKKGYWYGVDTSTGKYIATSGWEFNGYVAMYFKNGDSWNMEWIDPSEEKFDLEGIPAANTEGKMSFKDWLKAEQDIEWEDFDENYSNVEEFETAYESYLYDGLPGFVVATMLSSH